MDKSFVKDIDEIEKDVKIEKKAQEKEKIQDNKNDSSKEKTDDDENSKKINPNYNFIRVVVVIILIFLAVIILNKSLQPNPDDNMYNGFRFALTEDNDWMTQIEYNNQVYNIAFDYHPRDVKNLNFDERIKPRIKALTADDNFIIAVDENASSTAVIAGHQISRLYKNRFLQVPIHGVIYDENINITEYLNDNSSKTLDKVNCDMASEDFLILRFTNSNETKVMFKDNTNPNCIIGYAKDPEDFRKIADRLVYELIGIIK